MSAKELRLANIPVPGYLEPKYTEFNVDFYSLRIDRANLPIDKVDGVLHPDTLVFTLNTDITSIPGVVPLSHENLVTMLMGQEKAVQEGKYSSPINLAYLLRGYEPLVQVFLRKQDFFPDTTYPKGCSDIDLIAEYAGPKGMTITSIKLIAAKHGLEQRKSV